MLGLIRGVIVWTLMSTTGLAAFAESTKSSHYDYQVEAAPEENFNYAAAQLWLPNHPSEIQGILCLILHPLDRGGAKLAQPQPWIDLATARNCGLLAISFAQSDDPTADWCHAEQGTGRALISALDGLAQETGISKLRTTPLTVMGVCAAGQYAFHLAAFAPARVRAFVTIGGGKHDLSMVGAAAHAYALIVVTPDRPDYAVTNLKALYAKGRAQGAPWITEVENIHNYDGGMCSAFVLSFLQTSLEFDIGSGRAFREETLNASGTSRYLPISICGERLPLLAALNPGTVSLRASALEKAPTCSLDVTPLAGSTFDSISVPIQNPSLNVTVLKTPQGNWRLKCKIDPDKLPLGPSRIEVPVRFASKGLQLLGGRNTHLTCFVSGDVSCTPPELFLGSVNSGRNAVFSLHLFSKSGSPIRIKSAQGTYPWVQLNLTGNGGSYVCTVNPPSDVPGQEYAGYLNILLSSPLQRTLRVFYYGAINTAGQPYQPSVRE